MSNFRIAKNLLRPVANNTTLFICDVQDRFRPLIHNMETVIHKSEHLNKVCNKLDIPCLITEQYRKAFGATVPEITRFPNTKILEKTKFSMVSDQVKAEFLAHRKQVCDWSVSKYHLKNNFFIFCQVILVGIEAHVCVLQTCFDLLEEDIQVFLVTDAASSQR